MWCTYFDILNCLGVDHQCNRQTDGQTELRLQYLASDDAR